MKDEDIKQCLLPKKRTGRIARWIEETSIGRMLLYGLMAYLLPVVVISGVECLVPESPKSAWVKSGQDGETSFWNLLYFNAITILTIGYGDYSPHGTGARLLSVLEAFWGTGVMTAMLSALIAKFLSPPKDAIVFSKYAYYCREPQEFLVIFVNTTNNRVVNAEVADYFKLGGDWRILPAFRTPLITRAVQTFHTANCPLEDIVALLDTTDPENRRDAFRFGISGQIGNGTFSTAIEYGSNDIIVIPNRDELTAYKGFWFPNFDDPELLRMFHYRPEGALTLVQFVKKARELQHTDFTYY